MVKTIIDGGSRSPSWGAWIEIPSKVFEGIGEFVAPPRGERGLKYHFISIIPGQFTVAPPRGERGLK